MTKIESQIIEASEVEINPNLLATETGMSLLNKLKFKSIESTSIQKSDRYLDISSLFEPFGDESSVGSIMNTNQFLLMLSNAFNKHKPIILKPDYLWLLICQGFSEHIKNNSFRLKKKIINLSNKGKISVRRDDFIKGQNNPWEEICPEFATKIGELLKRELLNNIVLQFSTTTINEKVAFEIAFMDSMSNFIEYEFLSLCGIPKIEIKGTIEDYEKIITNLSSIRKYNLEWWIDKIIPIIERIIRTLKGEIDKNFWTSIFKENNESGGPEITGWITRFFPYITVEKVSKSLFGVKVKRKTVKNPVLMDIHDIDLKLGNFPSGISKVPFKWKFLNSEYNMNFISGFIGIHENTKTNFLETEINWIISEDK